MIERLDRLRLAAWLAGLRCSFRPFDIQRSGRTPPINSRWNMRGQLSDLETLRLQ